MSDVHGRRTGSTSVTRGQEARCDCTKFAGARDGESNERLRVVGIVGGTFDPIHYGHLRMALEVSTQLTLDEVRFIPSARPPHRGEPGATEQQRLEMVELAILGEERFILDDREYHRGGESYMVDTLESLRTEMGGKVSLILIMGSDAFQGLADWHRWQSLLEFAHIVVVTRPGSSCTSLRPLHTAHPVHNSELDLVSELCSRDLALQKFYDRHHTTDQRNLHKRRQGSIFTVETTALGISASSIRKMIAAQESPRFLLPETVLNYIEEHKLYR